MSNDNAENKKFGTKKSILKMECPPWLYQSFQKFIPGRLILRMTREDFVLYFQKKNETEKLVSRASAKSKLKKLIETKQKKKFKKKKK